jgi:hypothetical protein
MVEEARSAWRAAFARACAENLIPYPAVSPRRDPTPVTLWLVKTYDVRVIGPHWYSLSCDCRAGKQGKICKHAAVVAKARALGVRPIRGTAKVAEAPASAPSVPTVHAQASAIAAGDPTDAELEALLAQTPVPFGPEVQAAIMAAADRAIAAGNVQLAPADKAAIMCAMYGQQMDPRDPLWDAFN